MSDTTAGLRRKIHSAEELQSVVRTMKALAAANIGQYEQSVTALADYYRSVELGLGVCFRTMPPGLFKPGAPGSRDGDMVGAVVFGSDQGLVGQFNELVAEFALEKLAEMPAKPLVWVVGERVHSRMMDSGLPLQALFNVPNSIKAISPLVGQILMAYEEISSSRELGQFYLFYNHPLPSAGYESVSQRLLPLDENWRRNIVDIPWPGNNLPEVIGGKQTLSTLIREYLFVSLFRASAESLSSENASRLAAMQRAEKNIDEMLDSLKAAFHHLRQTGIDDELFDVISGYEALSSQTGRKAVVD